MSTSDESIDLLFLGEICRGLLERELVEAGVLCGKPFCWSPKGFAELAKLQRLGLITRSDEEGIRVTDAGKSYVRAHQNEIRAAYPADRPWRPPRWLELELGLAGADDRRCPASLGLTEVELVALRRRHGECNTP